MQAAVLCYQVNRFAKLPAGNAKIFMWQLLIRYKNYFVGCLPLPPAYPEFTETACAIIHHYWLKGGFRNILLLRVYSIAHILQHIMPGYSLSVCFGFATIISNSGIYGAPANHCGCNRDKPQQSQRFGIIICANPQQGEAC